MATKKRLLSGNAKSSGQISKAMSTIFFSFIILTVLFAFTNCSTKKFDDGGLRIGWAMEDITPDGPVSLSGQYYERISKYVKSPLKVTACAIEKVDKAGNTNQAIMISADLVGIPKTLTDSLKSILKTQIPGFDVNNLFINATHTHSAPSPDVKTDYGGFLLKKLYKATADAWKNKKPAGISSALRYAVTGHNRRVEYADGTTQMYGLTDREDFIGLEGPTDPGVDMLFCWDLNGKLIGIIMNVSCPSQVTEAKYFVSSDYWGEVRNQIKTKFSDDVFILPQCGAAGDVSPRDLPRGYKAGEPNMWDIPGMVEIGKRLIHVVEDAYPEAKKNIQTDVVFRHTVENIDLPSRIYTEEEYNDAVKIVERIRGAEPKDSDSPETAWNRFLAEIKQNEQTKEYGPWDNKLSDFGIVKKKEALIERYKNQEDHPYCNVEVHAIRLGDVAFATNPFELFVEYGFRITGRSQAKQTFLIQLTCSTEGYLPTKRAVEGEGYRGYSAMVNKVGPVGGQVLVNETVKMINRMWE